MPKYRVTVTIDAVLWLDAEDAEDAEDIAHDIYSLNGGTHLSKCIQDTQVDHVEVLEAEECA
jgi:hypothetical protein